MNKKELVSALAEQSGASQAVAGEILNAFCEVVNTRKPNLPVAHPLLCDSFPIPQKSRTPVLMLDLH